MSAALLLINCEACGKQYSKKASACPGCANPNETLLATSGIKATTIEQTSKKYKKGLIFGVVSIVFGFVLFNTSPGAGSLLLGVGLCLLLWARFGAWWNNG